MTTTLQPITHVAASRRDPASNRYTTDTGTVHLTGIHALVRAIRDRALADRARGLSTASYVSGYEGSPLGGLDLELARRRELLEPLDIVAAPAVNEELGATAVQGSQLAASVGTLRDGIDGVVGYWYGKAPGLDRAADALRHANLSGTSATGGAVAIVGDDPEAKSSTVPSDSRRLLRDLGMPILVPADAADTVRLGQHAAWLSRASGLWSALLITTAVADGSATWHAAARAEAPAPPSGDVHHPTAHMLGVTLKELEDTRVGTRLDRARAYLRDHGLNRLTRPAPAARVGIIAAGPPAAAVKEAVTALPHPDSVRVLDLAATWPLLDDEIASFADGLDEILVAEDRGSFLLDEVRLSLFSGGHRPRVHHVDGGVRDGAVTPARVTVALSAFVEVPARRGPRQIRLPLAAASRTPHFCSGCPHNSSTRATGDSLVGAGIGCHVMVLLMDPDRVGDVTGTAQMGGEGAHWIGMSPFVTQRHLVQNLGDGTFFHSGSLAIRALVAAGANCTVKLLHNGTVAMTGGQDAVGARPLAGIVDILRAEGVRRIVVTTDDVTRTRRDLGRRRRVEVRDRGELDAVQRELSDAPGVTVLIHDQACATELRRARKRGRAAAAKTKVIIDERICEGCGDCGAKSGCLSVQPVDTPFGRKTRIDQSSCNADYSCLAGDCPAFVTVPADATAPADTPEAADPADIPDPPTTGSGVRNIRITGVGGTGVLTVAALLATAAGHDGHEVRGRDMTGLAQKGGSVVSDLRIFVGVPASGGGGVPEGAADALIAIDGLTTAEPGNLAVIDPARTVTVVSSSDHPTGVMCTDVTASRPNGVALAGAIGAHAARAVTVDAAAEAELLTGDATQQTLILLGAAVQSGVTGIRPDSVERAISDNGVAIEANLAAFRRGRALVAGAGHASGPVTDAPAPDAATMSATRAALGPGVPEALVGDVAMRAAELARWGRPDHATGFLSDMATVAAVDPDPGAEGSLTATAAFGLHKLTAVKDEYEVARLIGASTAAGDEMGTRLLHPPFLRALGMKRKLKIRGRGGRLALRALAACKPVRGTALDPFGHTEVRRADRRVLADYRAALLAAAHSGDHGLALDVAKLADMVRGYEEVRLANIDRFDRHLRELIDGTPVNRVADLER